MVIAAVGAPSVACCVQFPLDGQKRWMNKRHSVGEMTRKHVNHTNVQCVYLKGIPLNTASLPCLLLILPLSSFFCFLFCFFLFPIYKTLTPHTLSLPGTQGHSMNPSQCAHCHNTITHIPWIRVWHSGTVCWARVSFLQFLKLLSTSKMNDHTEREWTP